MPPISSDTSPGRFNNDPGRVMSRRDARRRIPQIWPRRSLRCRRRICSAWQCITHVPTSARHCDGGEKVVTGSCMKTLSSVSGEAMAYSVAEMK